MQQSTYRKNTFNEKVSSKQTLTFDKFYKIDTSNGIFPISDADNFFIKSYI